MATSQSHSDHDICTEMLYILQTHGADPLLTDSNGFDALSHMARINCSANILRCLVLFWKEARERLQCTDDAARAESKALHQVTHTDFPDLEKMQILLDAGVSPQWEDSDGRTLLFAAAYRNRTTEAMNMLLKAGANPDNGGSKGYPPILRTLHDASLDKFMFFLDRGASPNAVDSKGSPILQLVVEHETLAVIKGQAVSYLLQRGAIVYDVTTHVAPAFIAAARQPNREGWDEVLLYDLLLRIPHIHRQRQLDIALKAACGSISTICFGNFLTVFQLLSLGANPSVIDGGATALLQIVCWACRAKDHDYKGDLLHLIGLYDSDLDGLDSAGLSPLHHTINNNSRDFSLVLLDFSANPNMVDPSGHTALQRLCSLDVPKYSIAKNFGEIEGTIKDLRYAGVRGSAAWRHDRRNIHMHIKRSLEQEEIFQALVDHSADLMVLDLQGRSLLILASEKGNSVLTANVLYRLGKERFNEAIYTVDSNGQTAVHFAAASGNIDTLKILLWPQNIMQASPNAWRQMAVNGEDDYQAKNSKSRLERHKERLEEQVNEYKMKLAIAPTFVVANISMMEHWEVKFTVGDNKRREEENISLPNVSTSTWTLQKSDSISLRGESWHDTIGRTPLHYAAERGHVEAIRLFLDYTDVDIDVEDRDGKKAIDLALDKNFYDVNSAIKTREAK
jgi:ankyrin repeat protein